MGLLNKKKEELIFIYNADNNMLNAFNDALKDESTDNNCKLSKLTVENFGMHPELHKFIEDSGLHLRFMHRDDFERRYVGNAIIYPAGVLTDGKNLNVIVSNKEIGSCKNLDALENLVIKRLEKYRGKKQS